MNGLVLLDTSTNTFSCLHKRPDQVLLHRSSLDATASLSRNLMWRDYWSLIPGGCYNMDSHALNQHDSQYLQTIHGPVLLDTSTSIFCGFQPQRDLVSFPHSSLDATVLPSQDTMRRDCWSPRLCGHYRMDNRFLRGCDDLLAQTIHDRDLQNISTSGYYGFPRTPDSV